MAERLARAGWVQQGPVVVALVAAARRGRDRVVRPVQAQALRRAAAATHCRVAALAVRRAILATRRTLVTAEFKVIAGATWIVRRAVAAVAKSQVGWDGAARRIETSHPVARVAAPTSMTMAATPHGRARAIEVRLPIATAALARVETLRGIATTAIARPGREMSRIQIAAHQLAVDRAIVPINRAHVAQGATSV